MRLSRTLAAFVSRQRVGHLATADAAGRPHVVPICFALDRATLYSVLDRKPKRETPKRLRRVRNVTANPRVAVVVDTYAEDWARLGFVLVEGRARVIEGGAEHAKALRLLIEKYPQYRKMELAGRPVIAVAIRRAVGWGRLDRPSAARPDP